MPPKKRVALPDSVRDAVLADVELTYRESIDTDTRSKIRIFLATEQGLSTYDIAHKLGVSQGVVSKWSRLGKEALARREEERQRGQEGNRSRGDDPDRSGEPSPVG
ncbi:hypothetical protein ACI2L4_25005 [Streptomyces sparsogenes]|uniref:hypothetical protein n=1 Tax=Streptomyces sparsogenes TaxID=67365 RepID=UPI00384C9B2E